MYAALYAALVIVLGGISFGPVQVRIADSMVAAVPLLGLPGVLGHTLGVFVGNLYSPLGPIDLLNTIPSFAMSFVVYYIYKRTKNDYTVIGSCAAYSVVLGITVGWMLSAPFNIPLPFSIAYVIIGNVSCNCAHRMATIQITEKKRCVPKMVSKLREKLGI